MRDEHCHIIWGVDDGARTEEMSLQMLEAAIGAGIDHIVCTPHMRWSDFDQEVVQQRFAWIEAQAAARGTTMALAYEVYFKKLVEIGIGQAGRFVEQGTNRLLLEFDTGGEVPFGWEHTFYELQASCGLEIAVAHPERYTTVWENFDIVYRMKSMGCRLQVSAMDLFAGMFNPIAKCAKRIISEGLCDALVSDAHRPDHYALLAKAAAKYAS